MVGEELPLLLLMSRLLLLELIRVHGPHLLHHPRRMVGELLARGSGVRTARGRAAKELRLRGEPLAHHVQPE